jgi:hypothetical protein
MMEALVELRRRSVSPDEIGFAFEESTVYPVCTSKIGLQSFQSGPAREDHTKGFLWGRVFRRAVPRKRFTQNVLQMRRAKGVRSDFASRAA